MPIESRHGPAITYLTAGALDLPALAVLLISDDRLGWAALLPAACGLILAYLAILLFRASPARAADFFP